MILVDSKIARSFRMPKLEIREGLNEYPDLEPSARRVLEAYAARGVLTICDDADQRAPQGKRRKRR